MDPYTILNSQFTVFTEPTSRKKFAKCSYCSSLLKYHHSTSSLTYHLKSKHSISRTVAASPEAKPIISSQSTSNTVTIRRKNLLSSKNNEIAIQLTKWIASSARSLDILEDDGLKTFLRAVTRLPNLEIPSKQDILSDVKELYETEKVIVKDMLRKAEFLALSTDHWMSGDKSFLSVRCHYICPDWRYRSLLLGVKHTPDTNRTFHIKEQFSNLLLDYGKEILNKSFHSVTDSCTPMHDTDALKADHTQCMAKFLLLSVNNAGAAAMHGASADHDRITNKVSECYDSYKKEHSTSPAAGAFLLANLTMSEDIAIAWRQTYAMADELIKNKYQLSHQPSAKEWIEICNMHKLFGPIEKAISILGGKEYSSASSIFPLIAYLRQQMAAGSSDSTFILEFKQAFRSHLSSCMSNTLHVLPLQVATAFDIRYKRLLSLPKDQRADVWAAIETMTRAMGKATSQCEAPVAKKARSSLLSLASDDREEIVSALDAETDPYLLEFEMYKHLPQVCDDDICPLNWWKENASAYPTLSKIAKKYLTIPSTSAPCEELFSNSREKLIRKRSALLPGNINTLLCLSDWQR